MANLVERMNATIVMKEGTTAAKMDLQGYNHVENHTGVAYVQHVDESNNDMVQDSRTHEQREDEVQFNVK